MNAKLLSRRFGLFDRKETLEQIGELLGITRERVRQLEKAILIRLKLATEDGKVPVGPRSRTYADSSSIRKRPRSTGPRRRQRS